MVWNKKYFTEEEKRLAKNKTQRKWLKNHKKERKIYTKKHYQNNKQNILEKVKIYYQNHKEEKKIYHKEYTNDKLKTDIQFRLALNLRNRIRKALHNNQKSGSAVKDLGCSISELKTHLESKFQDGMTWENWGYTGWHIDHIIPLSFFNLSNREEFLKAVHYTNLQPLWSKENLKKNNKILIKS